MSRFAALLTGLVLATSTHNSLADEHVDQQLQVMQDAILQRDEIIRALIKRLDLLEGDLKALKNNSRIQRMVEDSLERQNAVTPVTADVDAESETGQVEVVEESLAEKAFARELSDRGGLVLPLYQSVLTLGMTTTSSTTDNILIDGFTIFPVLVVGDIISERARRDVTRFSLRWRIGLPHDFQFEAALPWSYLESYRVEAEAEEKTSYDTGRGDIEIGLSYQLTKGHDWYPDSLVSARWKGATAADPYDHANPETRVTGSGFDALNVYYTAVSIDDPLAYYGSISYTHVEADRKDIGRIQPGPTLGISLGVTMGINLRSSWSFGFNQSWTERTRIDSDSLPGTELNAVTLTLGNNYTINQRYSLNFSLAIGLTEDSPDYQFGVSVPIRL